ncbi:D-alanyl-D-alanine carboxypeptidase/D-alanyl-D-alanine-endopeptidase [Aquiluna borgnonia]|uniref:D-alanyl-D-alanine carboxypeptidase/D-alanyl-D-alanine-endopeptidase n=1 Tax=Aquiluna borgnonia TaxID=2499157 RepID=A0A7D4PZH0_9MICO|nr:D-alanyl-D-alanine carboxypeptidase/D-alanyl-D-alanine-endopeptidase [Aquiluna borgnonia]QKJ25705.1 D-alanyl-D-alanine carboxypeptidase/D-alanyl-D-alanine-endopeptidase [Aquiluna borgnonia]
MNSRSRTLILAAALALAATFPTPAHAASCTPAKQLASSNIKQLHAEVVNAQTGQTLFSVAEQEAQRTASVMKVLTAAVALDVLGPDHVVTTNVYSDPANPGSIYLVGAGDVTLSRMPGNITSYYAKAPKLDTLTKQIASWAKKNAVTISSVTIDNSLYGSDAEWHKTWSKKGLSQGYMAPVSALQIDAGRLTSTKYKNSWLSRRTSTPVKQAGELFVASLNKSSLAKGIKAQQGKLPEGAVVIASVSSRPMSEWIANMLRVSDNSLAEALGRLSSIAAGFDGSMASLTPLYQRVLGARGIDVSKVKIVDGSGLSRENAVPASVVTDLLELVHQQVGNYAVLEAGLPVSGSDGSLKSRFATGSKTATKGLVVAKTGYITTGYSLAGYLTARDGTKLIFTVYNLAPSVGYNQRLAMDNLVYRFYQCGASLSG